MNSPLFLYPNLIAELGSQEAPKQIMAKLPEHPRCPHCGSYDTERHWGDQFLQVGASIIGGFASGYFLGDTVSGDTVAKGAESLVNGFSQKYTCNECDRDFTLEESESEDTVTTGSLDYDPAREDIVERASFEMEIEDVFEIEGRGIVITGRIFTGCIYKGETINISDSTGPEYHAEVIGIEMFRKLLDRAEEGDNCGLLIKGVNKRDIKPGMVASHILHINIQPTAKKDNDNNVEPERKPMEINESDPPKGKFMKGLHNLSVKKGCKIPMLSDEEVINIGAEFGVDPIYCLRIAQKNDAADKLEAAQKVSSTTKNDSYYSENEKSYIEEYRQCLSDGEISPAEIRLLKKLAISLGISEARVRELETSCKEVILTEAEKQYLEEYKACLEDGPEISASTRRLLNRLASSLNLTDNQVSRLEKM